MRLPVWRGLILMAVLSAGASPTRAAAARLPHLSIENVVKDAEVIVRARVSGPNEVQVEEALYGGVKPNDKIHVGLLSELARVKYDQPPAGANPPAGDSVEAGELMLFLHHGTPDHPLMPVGVGSGAKWIVGERVFGYRQLTPDAPYLLLPDRQAPTLAQLRAQLQAALAKRRRFEAALALTDPAPKIAALTPFISRAEQDAKPYPVYLFPAIEALYALGPAAGPPLRAALVTARPGRPRQELIAALGDARDPEAWPTLAPILEASRAALRPLSGPLNPTTLSPAQRDALGDWHAALYALMRLGDVRGRGWFQDSLGWTLDHSSEFLVEYSLLGMEKTPDAGHVAPIRRTLAAIERFDPADRSRIRVAALHALGEQQQRDSAPAIAPWLKDTDVTVRDAAHAALVRIAGADLGTDAAAWLKWAGGN